MTPRDDEQGTTDQGAVYFLEPEDAAELGAALRAEGYAAAGRDCQGPGRARYALDVSPYDDGLVAMVDVYGGWLPEEA
jgi:hypothetical protein